MSPAACSKQTHQHKISAHESGGICTVSAHITCHGSNSCRSADGWPPCSTSASTPSSNQGGHHRWRCGIQRMQPLHATAAFACSAAAVLACRQHTWPLPPTFVLAQACFTVDLVSRDVDEPLDGACHARSLQHDVCAVGVVHGERQTVTEAVVHMRLQERRTRGIVGCDNSMMHMLARLRQWRHCATRKSKACKGLHTVLQCHAQQLLASGVLRTAWLPNPCCRPLQKLCCPVLCWPTCAAKCMMVSICSACRTKLSRSMDWMSPLTSCRTINRQQTKSYTWCRHVPFCKKVTSAG